MNDNIKTILKIHGNRKHSIVNSIGVYDIYKDIRKNKWHDIGRPVTEHEFYSVIRTVNNILVEYLSEGKEIILPHRMGVLEIRKYKPIVKIKDGKLYNNLPVDWKRTLELWDSDEESHINKRLVKQESKEIFRLMYSKTKANYNNKSFMEFRFNRNIKKALKDNINDNKIDAFTL